MTTPLKRLALTAMAALGLTAAAASADPLDIRIAWSQMPGHMIPVLFTHKEVLKHYGVTYVVTPILFRGSTPQITAMAANEIDMGTFSPTALTLAVTNAHLNVKATADVLSDGMKAGHSDAFMVRADSGIRTVADLKGKRIGTNAIGSVLDTSMRVITARHGLQDKRDFTVIEAAFPNMPAMIEEEKIDCGPILEPYQDIAEKSGKLRVLFTNKDAVGPAQSVVLAARADFLAAHHDALLDFYEDYIRAFRWFMDPRNRTASIGIIANFMHQPPANLGYLFTSRDYYRDPYLVPTPHYIQTAADAALAAGAIAKSIQVEPGHVDLSYILAAKARVIASDGPTPAN